MKPKQFKGWRLLRRHERVRVTDRWTYDPAVYKSPVQMNSIARAHSILAGETLDDRASRVYDNDMFVYRRKTK